MKIDIYTDTYNPEVNGVVTCINVLKKGIRERGNKVNIFAPKVPGYKDLEKGVYRISSMKVIDEIEQRMALPLPTRHFGRALLSTPNIIHAHSLGPLGTLGLILAKTRRVPFVFSYHMMIMEYVHYLFGGRILKPWILKRFVRFYCNLADWIIVPSTKLENELRSWGVKKPISVVPNGVDLSKFNGDGQYLIKRGYVKKGDRVLLYVGRIAKEKNLGFLIKLFPKIQKIYPKMKMVIVGDGPELGKLKKMVPASQHSIVFTGLVMPSEIAEVYACGDIFVFSSKSEVHPYSILEALAGGLPIVVLKDDAHEKMIRDGYNGYICDSQDSFAEAICKIVNSGSTEKFGENSKKIAKKHFSAEISLKNHFEVFNKVLQNHRRDDEGLKGGGIFSLTALKEKIRSLVRI